jgi:hypothetical protein
VKEAKGRPCVYTLGCEDPFFLDDPIVVLYVDELRRPESLTTPEEEEESERKWRLRAGEKHGWSGPK